MSIETRNCEFCFPRLLTGYQISATPHIIYERDTNSRIFLISKMKLDTTAAILWKTNDPNCVLQQCRSFSPQIHLVMSSFNGLYFLCVERSRFLCFNKLKILLGWWFFFLLPGYGQMVLMDTSSQSKLFQQKKAARLPIIVFQPFWLVCVVHSHRNVPDLIQCKE